MRRKWIVILVTVLVLSFVTPCEAFAGTVKPYMTSTGDMEEAGGSYIYVKENGDDSRSLVQKKGKNGKEKILLTEEGTRSLLSSINELYIEGRGWMERDSFFKEFRGKNYFLDPTRPIVDTIKVNFKNLQNGECGQRDILPCVLRELWKQPRSMNSNRKLRLQKNYH